MKYDFNFLEIKKFFFCSFRKIYEQAKSYELLNKYI